MCDINCVWLFHLLVAVVLILLQAQQNVFANKAERYQHPEQHRNISPYKGISSYAAAAAANYLRRTSMPHSVAKREVKNTRRADLISYMSDFNMQDETSIPEDIIDQQHLQEIIDKQQQEGTQQQRYLQQAYVSENTASSSALKGDVDIIDVNLPYDDSADTDSDADIILASQRTSERGGENRSVCSGNKDCKTDNVALKGKKDERENRKKNFLKSNSKTLKNKNDNEDLLKRKPQNKDAKSIGHVLQYSTFGDVEGELFKKRFDDGEADEDKFELDDDDDDGSAEYERFKSMREQKQKQQQQQEREQQKQQMSGQKTIIIEETFNSQESNEKNSTTRDDDKLKPINDYTDGNERNINIDDFEIFHKHLMEERKKLLQKQQYGEEPPKQDAIGDIEDNEKGNIFTAVGSKHEERVENTFIPSKMKRHNGAARLDDSTNKFTRVKQNEPQQQQLKSQVSTEESFPDAVAKVSSQEESFKNKYYDILKENSTATSSHSHSQQHQLYHSSEETNPKDLNSNADNNERESVHEAERKTAFEKEKSLRRNNKRYGHKIHKKKYKDYLRYSQIMMLPSTSNPPLREQNTTEATAKIVAGSNILKDKHFKKLKLEEIKTVIPPAPIFVLKAPKDEGGKGHMAATEKVEEPTTKPFYEGQINYFLETPDDDSERANEVRFITKGERIDTNDWYRRLSPVLRNGNKKSDSVAEQRSGIGTGRSRGGYATTYNHYRPQHHGQTRNHHYYQQHHHHQHQKQQARPAHHHQTLKHSRHHAYQRKVIPKRLPSTTTPLPPPSRKQLLSENGVAEVGHQITDIKEFDRYYAKWPHLARVQSQLHEEQLREQQSENYPDYEYDNDDYFEDSNNKDENLPPYVRKFNRRNKQLLDLLEGTIAPTTKPPQQLRWSDSKLQPGPRDSSVGSMSVRIDDDYLKEKRKRYHQRQRQIHDLFAQQRTTTSTSPPPPYPFDNANVNREETAAHTENHLPDEDVSISLESNEQENESNIHSANYKGGSDDDANNDLKAEQEIWQKEIETKSANVAAGNLEITNWQMEKLITSTPTATATAADKAAAAGEAGISAKVAKKSAIHKLPSYPSIAGGYMNRPRSRSAQFAPSSGSEYRRVTSPHLSHFNNNHNDNDNMNNNNNNFINAGGFVAYNKAPVVSRTINGRFSANTPNDYNKQQEQQQQQQHQHPHLQTILSTTSAPTDTERMQSSGSSTNNHLTPPSPSAPSSSVTNSFIYHRVVDASPRLVGAGFVAGRKQRLPFVAITDRRLETSKKSLTEHHKDFEQNLYPLP